MIRICPERDGRCPHGMDCPFSIDRYRCDIEKSREALKTPGKPMTDISESGIEAAVKAHNTRQDPTLYGMTVQDYGLQQHAREVVQMTAAIQAYLPFHPPASRDEGLRVKELAWEVEEPNWWVARSIVGGYEVRQTDSGKVRTRRVGDGWEYFDGTAEQAKSAAQEHYTNAILSAIETASKKPE